VRRYVDERMSRQRIPAAEHTEIDERPLDIRELVSKFLRRKRLFLYVSILLFLILAVNQLTKPYSPIYRATFDIGIVQERTSETFFSGSRISDIPTMQIGAVTQRVIASLLSVNLAEKVVEEMSLYAFVDNGDYDLKVEAGMNTDFSQPFGPLNIRIINGSMSIVGEDGKTVDKIFGQVQISKDGRHVKDGIVNENIDLGPCYIKVIPLNENALNKNYTVTIYPKSRLAFALRNSVSIKVLEADRIEQEFGSSGVPFSGEGASKQLVMAKSIFPGMNLIGILRIDVHWGNPRDALKIANALADQILIADRIEKSQQFTQSKAFIDSQLVFYQSNLNKLEDDIRRFKESKNIADLRASTQALITQVSELESRKNQLEIEQNVLGDLNTYLVNATASDTVPNYALSMLSDEVLREFYSELLQSEAELRGRLKEYSSNHPKVMEIRARLGGLKEQLKAEIGNRMSSIRTEIAGYSTQIRFLQGKLDNVPLDEVNLARLERDRETAEKLYTFFAEKLEETRVQEAAVTSDLKIINPPVVSYSAANKRGRLRGGIIAMVLSLMAGSFAVLLVEYLDNTIKDPEKTIKEVGLPLFASIPATGDDAEKKRNLLDKVGLRDEIDFITKHVIRRPSAGSQQGVQLINDDMNSPEFEAFRKLAVNLDFVHPYKKYRVLYITSSGPEEGKTFLALNLGYVIGSMGKKVMLIDTDFRKKSGHLTEVTKLKRELGLFDILMGAVEPQDVTLHLDSVPKVGKKQENHKVDLLPLGKIPPNPFVFLESDRMRNLIADLKETYEYLVIDGVPLLLFADAAYLANNADGVLLAARYGKTTTKELENSRDILINAKSNIIGVVMNDVPKTRGSYYYQHYYKYYSKYYKREKA
jgi:succinoglycan biosynthesis transport protein ExoP